MKDYYKILEVVPGARKSVIDAAYHALIKEHHPDHGASGILATELNEAHSILTDEKKRKGYNRDRNDDTGKYIGPYKIIKQIAEGGFGRTYKAEHKILKELTCIKDCSNVLEEDSKLLIDECKTLWDLRHYALPAMRDLIQLDDGRILLVMSYIEGPTLRQQVEKTGALDPEAVAWITERLLNALNYIHRHGVVHGDLKPQNIIIQEDRHMAVLVDFGLSVVKPTSTSESRGYTMFYSPPEEMNGKPLIPESDYYSLGMTMLYALSGSDECVERKVVPSHIPNELCDFIKRLIARDVKSRPQYPNEDLGDIIADLRVKVFGRHRSGMKPIVGV